MPCDIDDFARYFILPQKSANGHKVGLHSTVWRRIRPQQKHSHCWLDESWLDEGWLDDAWLDDARNWSRSREQGKCSRWDCSMRRHPRVERTPSRTVMSGDLPSRSAEKNDCI